jgi:hypothetical protein
LTVKLPFPAGEFLAESAVPPCRSVLGITNRDGALIANIGVLGSIFGD